MPLKKIFSCLLTVFLALGAASSAHAENRQPPLAMPVSDSEEENSQVQVELFLMKNRKADIDQIVQELKSASIDRIRTNFYPAGKAVQILAVGRKTPASVARLGIRLAMEYNEGIQYLLPQVLIPHHYLAIGTSAFDEKSQIPIGPEDLERLRDPSLSTREFHALYESLTENFEGLYP